jgi:nucleotide-binding universal stress UspA family protein
LLATDLSGRGDRALDRALLLADAWGAELLIVHALEERPGWSDQGRLPSWRRPPDAAALAERQIRADVGDASARVRILIREGPAAKVILDAAAQDACDLVVVGLGRQRPWGGFSRTVDELFRASPASVLVVKRRPHGPYGHVLVGSDFTPEARSGLEVAAQLFPAAKFVLMHAYEMPYRALLGDSQLGQDFAEMEQTTLRSFLDEAELPDAVRRGITPLIEHGPPEAMLSSYVMENGADLIVIGAYERSRLLHAVVRGKGPRIVEAAPSDVLVVRADRASE